MWWLGGLVNTHIGTMCVCVRVFGGLYIFCIWMGGLCVVVWWEKEKKGGGGGGVFALGSFSSFFFCLYS